MGNIEQGKSNMDRLKQLGKLGVAAGAGALAMHVATEDGQKPETFETSENVIVSDTMEYRGSPEAADVMEKLDAAFGPGLAVTPQHLDLFHKTVEDFIKKNPAKTGGMEVGADSIALHKPSYDPVGDLWGAAMGRPNISPLLLGLISKELRMPRTEKSE